MSYLQNLSITQRISVTLVGTLLAVAIASGLILGSNYLRWDITGYMLDERVESVILAAVSRAPDGHLVLQRSPQLESLERAAPGLWFVVRDRGGDQQVVLRCGRATASPRPLRGLWARTRSGGHGRGLRLGVGNLTPGAGPR